MIGLSIHIPSLFIGFVVGYILISALFLWFGYDERYHNGFSRGWDCGVDYGRKETKDREVMEGETNEEHISGSE